MQPFDHGCKKFAISVSCCTRVTKWYQKLVIPNQIPNTTTHIVAIVLFRRVHPALSRSIVKKDPLNVCRRFVYGCYSITTPARASVPVCPAFERPFEMSDTAVVEMERPSNVDVGANERVRRDEDVDEAVVL